MLQGEVAIDFSGWAASRWFSTVRFNRKNGTAAGSSRARPLRTRSFGLVPILFSIGLAALGYIVVGLVATRLHQPVSGAIPVEVKALPEANPRLRILTWNLGYAGLGADADFAADGGTGYFPDSRAMVERNLAGIAATLGRVDADAFLIQEIAISSPLNFWVDVREGLAPRFAGYAEILSIDIATRFLLPPLRLAHGKAIYSSRAVVSAERVALPLEDDFLMGVVRNNYSMLVARIPILDSDRAWVLINVHLAAFDQGGDVRRRQLIEVLRFAANEYALGNPVVIGGDFNMEFMRDRFSHRSDPATRFWLEDFPFDLLPSGWQAAYDRSLPTVRTLASPYQPGVTYVTMIDGFLVSPNVRVDSVGVVDTGFAYADHQGVLASFSLNS